MRSPRLGSNRSPEEEDDLLLGLDEAGRGSLLGPLVVGGYSIRRSALPRIGELGVKDSKLLSPERRAALYPQLARWGTRTSISLSPADVDAAVGRNELNLLEARGFARLIRRVRPTIAFVDACDPIAARFGDLVGRLSHNVCPVDARHRADRDLLVVGAASIVAKVRRDRAMERLRGQLGEGIGSGYPSDERTREFVRGHLRSDGDRPPWIRYSWKTLETLKPTPAPRRLESFSA